MNDFKNEDTPNVTGLLCRVKYENICKVFKIGQWCNKYSAL